MSLFGRKRHRFNNVDVEVTERHERDMRGYDPYPVWYEEIERENERREAEASALYREMLSEYREARRHLPTWEPDVEVKDYVAGKFLCFDGHEVPVAHIESVEVIETGGKPYKCEAVVLGGYDNRCWLYARVHKNIKDYPSNDERILPREQRWIVRRNEARIAVNMVSGRVKELTCWDFQVEIVKDRLEQAWKHGTTEDAA